MKKLISKRLIQLEIQNRITAVDMALICQVSESTYYRFRNPNEEKTPDYDVLKRLIDRFKIDASWLFNENIV